MQRIIKLFKSGNVCVTGLRGTGKDMLFANVIARRKDVYISNMDYKIKKAVHIPLQFDKLNVKNNYSTLISGEIVPYEYPYPENKDIYVSDCGVYFPSQDSGRLDKLYSEFPVFQALSRHLGNCNFHVNAQNLNRVWNKIREQSDIYITCVSCHVIGRIVFQRVLIYDKYESCVNRVQPYKHINPPLFAKSEVKAEYRSRDEVLYRQFKQDYGYVKSKILIYRNLSDYDTRLFKKILGGKK